MMTNLLKQYQLNYFDPAENSNKVWIGKAFADGTYEVRFGRVRENQMGMMGKPKKLSSGAAALAELERVANRKIKEGYRPTAVLGSEQTGVIVASAKPQELGKLAVEQIAGAAQDATTAELIKYLADVNIHNITHATSIRYDASNATFSTPLGVLTPDAIVEARQLLTRIERANSQSLASSFRDDLIREYFRLVPADFGARIPASRELLSTGDKIVKQMNILDALDSALKMTAPPQTEAEKLFKCKLTKVPHVTEAGRETFRKIKKLYESTLNAKHQTAGLKLTRVYEVEIESMKTDFEAAAKKLGNVREDLWHGTKASNLLSILKSGLMIPKSGSAHCTGRMFGDGIYTSLQSTKALNYATNFWNGSGAKNQRTFMFLTEVALGKMSEPKMRTGSFPKAGTHSTWVNAGSCGVMNHECIVYDTKQINLRYLCEFGAV